RRLHTRFSRDWSSDVCSSDLEEYESKLKELNNTYIAQSNMLSGKFLMTGNAFTDSILERLNNGETQSQIYKFFSVASKEYMALRSEERRVGIDCKCWEASYPV